MTSHASYMGGADAGNVNKPIKVQLHCQHQLAVVSVFLDLNHSLNRVCTMAEMACVTEAKAYLYGNNIPVLFEVRIKILSWY